MIPGSALTDREVLLHLFRTTDGERWITRHGWDTDDDVGSWFGVTANAEGRVIGLSLVKNNLSGQIPKELGDLLAVETLDISNNELTGQIPKELGDLPVVKKISLYLNSLTGEIPNELGNLSTVEHLNFRGNQLSGQIPKELGDLSVIKTLSLPHNKLTGDIPKELGNLPTLECLMLRGNLLSGPIPKELGDLSAVTELDLSGNRLTGKIPTELGKLAAAVTLRLSKNRLTGDIPMELGDLAAVKKIDVSFNQLTGRIPKELHGLPRFEELLRRGNNLTDVKPSERPTTSASAGCPKLPRGRPSESMRPKRDSTPPVASARYIAVSYADRVTAYRRIHGAYVGGAGGSLAPSGARGASARPQEQTAPRGGRAREIPAFQLRPTTTRVTGALNAAMPTSPNPPQATHHLNQDIDGGWFEAKGDIPKDLGKPPAAVAVASPRNAATGKPPVELGHSARIETPPHRGNVFTGEVPKELRNLPALKRLHISEEAPSGGMPTKIGEAAAAVVVARPKNQPAGSAMRDRQALNGLSKMTGGNSWTIRSYWGRPEDVGRWYGVTANAGNRVVGLKLVRNNIRGQIPKALGDLLAVETLDLSNNKLTGQIPKELGDLRGVKTLNLARNQLTGEIPKEIGNLANLQHLLLSENQLCGELPKELAGLLAVETIDLYKNKLTGLIPKELGDLPAVKTLNLAQNKLTGDIPKALGNLPTLECLMFRGNLLSGHIPEELGNLSAVIELDISGNQLTGEIPKELGKLVAVVTLSLSRNLLSGEIPKEVGDLAAVKKLAVSSNQLTGVIPLELGDLPCIESLSLAENNLTGEIPKELGNLPTLTALYLEGNQLSGQIPKELGELTAMVTLSLSRNELTGSVLRDREALLHLFRATRGGYWINRDGWDTDNDVGNWFGVTVNTEGRVVALNLVDNKLCGQIPKEIGDLPAIKILKLTANSLAGEIPKELGKLSTLEQLYLGGNQLSGQIPKELGELLAIKTLSLPNNKLTGEIPKELGKLSSVECLMIRGNLLSGQIPKELGDLTAVTEFDLSTNKLAGEIPKELGKLLAVVTLSFASNEITGPIPKELGELAAVRKLLLSRNRLTGQIPKELGDLPDIRTISMTENNLTGEIPKELGKLATLTSLYLQGNQLSGQIPKELGDLPAIYAVHLSRNRLTEVPLDLLLALRERGASKKPQQTAGISKRDLSNYLKFRKVNPSLKPLPMSALRKRDTSGGTLFVEENTLLRPPQAVMEMGLEHAISWWEDIARSGEGTSNKLKLVLVGLAEAGKTTLVRSITGTPVLGVLDRTVGIEITEGWKPVDGGSLEISIWDFAGQGDYYASHQIFLTKGSLFLLVVDLQALLTDTASGGETEGDPHGRVYRWLEMLHLRVPGAAVALVGTHTDAAEFTDPAELDEGVNRLEQLVARYRQDKDNETKATANANAPGRKADDDNMHRAELLDHRTSSRTAPHPLFIHDKVFRTSLDRDSTRELVEWVGKASTGLDCPEGFNFPAVGVSVPQVWVDANSAMDSLAASESGKRYVTWREAVQTFGDFMSAKSTPIPDSEEVLWRAMRHREAEGSVILSLDYEPPRVGKFSGMLYLDPTWLMEVIRRLTDHNLVDTAKEGNVKIELRQYCEEHTPGLKFDSLWAQHRSYRTSGTLDREYLRFLWLHRSLDNGLKLDLNLEEFDGVIETMVKLLVMYRAPATGGTTRELYVVPARFPEYGDDQVLENGEMGLGDAVVRVTCSFGQAYAPPGIIGRFLAFANAHIKEARQCWQHGAHLIWTPGSHDVLVYETQCVETSDGGSLTFAGIVLCVKGIGPEARGVLDCLTEEVRKLFADEVHGYPGLCSESFGDTEEVRVGDLSSELRKYLENRFKRLETLTNEVARRTGEVLQAFYLAAEEKNQYPRLFVLKPETTPATTAEVRTPPASGTSPTVRVEPEEEGIRGSAAMWVQLETWTNLIHALTERRKFRLIFICEHDMTEVECGPGGNGYAIQDLPKLLKDCFPLLQVTFYALRVVAGTVLHVDLPLDDLLAAVMLSAAAELLGATGTSLPSLGLNLCTPLPNESIAAEERQHSRRVQEEGYAALCQFMQRVEYPSTSCCGLRSRCSSCGSAQRDRCDCVSWRDAMVRVGNGEGGLVWVKKTNEAAYKQKIIDQRRGPDSLHTPDAPVREIHL